MKKTIFSLALCWSVLQGMAAEKLDWTTNLPEAKTKAKTEQKLVLMDFTGSDWCVWCHKLDKEIFSTPEFADYAAKNLILVQVDFPHNKPQPSELKRANKSLMAKYKVEGYPTIIVLNSAGKKVGELGYQEGGPKPFIAELQKLSKG